MSAPVELPTELWCAILPLTRNPVPPPLSCPPRTAIRQPHLSAAMRVSKLFLKICKPLLYTHVLTDNLPLLIRANADSTTKIGERNLDLIKTLMIEYSAKEKRDDPSYGQLLAVGKWVWGEVGASPEEKILPEVEREIKELRQCVGLLVKRGMSSVLPAVESMAISSRYGRNIRTWSYYEKVCGWRGTPPSTTNVTIGFQQLLMESKSLRHLCLRDTSGPLSFMRFYPSHSNTFHTTTHFAGDIGELPIVVGNPNRWCYEGPPTEEWSRIITNLGQRLKYAAHSPSFIKSGSLHLDIACSTSQFGPLDLDANHALFAPVPAHTPSTYESSVFHTPTYHTTRNLSPDDQREMSAQLETEVRTFVRSRTPADKSHMASKPTWRSSHDSPACKACGWGREL